MKQITTYIEESIKDEDKSIIDMLNMFANCSSGVQQELFKQKVKDADSVDIVPLSEVFSDDEIKMLENEQRKKQYNLK